MGCEGETLVLGPSGSLMGVDPFARGQVALPKALVDITSRYGLNTEEIETATATGGTVTDNTAFSAFDLDVTGTSGSMAAAQTKTPTRYQTGRAQSAIITGVWSDAGPANQIRYWGYGHKDAGGTGNHEGVFWVVEDGELSLQIISNVAGVANQKVLPSEFNLDDSVVPDITKFNIYGVPSYLQWLGGGDVVCFLNNKPVHKFENAGLNIGPYMASGTQRVCAWVENTGASTAATGTITCFSVASLGGDEDPIYTDSIGLGPGGLSVGTTLVPIIGIRAKASLNSVTNRGLVLPQIIDMAHNTGTMIWQGHFGGSITGGTWVSAGANSLVEYNITGTGYSAGTPVIRGAADAGEPIYRTLVDTKVVGRLGRSLRYLPFAAVQEEFMIIGQKDSGGGSTTVRGGLTWGEIRG